MGAHDVVHPKEAEAVVKQHTEGLGVDVVLEMSGVPAAIHQAFSLVRVGGRVQLLGIPSKRVDFDLANEIIFKGLTVYGVVGRRMYDTWLLMTRFLRSGQFDPTPVITHRFPLEAARRRDPGDQVGGGRQGHLRDRLIRFAPIRAPSAPRTPLSSMSLNTEFTKSLEDTIEQLKRDRVYKRLNYLDSPQSSRVKMEGRGDVLILSSNNYLGLCDEPAVVQAGIDGLKQLGAGTASVRFICGTFAIHRELEAALRQVRRLRVVAQLRVGVERERRTHRHDRAGGRLHRLRRAQPRVDHRLDAARQGDQQVHDRRLQARRHGRPARQARRGERASSGE